MRFLSLQKSNFFYSILVLLILSFTISQIQAFSNEVVERVSYDKAFDHDNYKNDDVNNLDTNSKESSLYQKRNPLILNDSVFSSNSNVTLNGLIIKVSLVLVMLLGVLALVKMLVSRNRFNQVGSILDEFAQKFTGSFSNFSNSQGLKLKQTLILTPGQNLYLVEIDGKRLLLGATHHGGVQFLTDLTQKSSQATNLSFKQIEEYQNQNKPPILEHQPQQLSKEYKDLNSQIKQSDFFANTQLETPFFNKAGFSQSNIEDNGKENQKQFRDDKEILSSSTAQSKQPLKRRTNFRQSLLSEAAINSSETLMKAK